MNTFFRPCFSVLLILLFCISCLPTYGFAETFDSSLPVEQSNEIILQEQTDVLVNSITVSAEKTSLSVGETLLLSAIILPEDATNKALLWTSSDETVLTVAQNGMLTAIGPGIANVSASSTDGNDIKSDLEISVIESTDAGYPKQLGNEYSTDGAENKIAISSITVSAEKTCLSVGETLPLSATILPEDATNKALLWTSSDETVLTVDQNGMLTAIGLGIATVSASSTDGNDIKSDLEISVIESIDAGYPKQLDGDYNTEGAEEKTSAAAINSITVSAEKTSLSVGETLLLSAIILPEDATNKALLWTSSDETVLTVDQNGMLTAIGPGIATVSASSTDGNDIKSDLEISVIDTDIPEQLLTTSLLASSLSGTCGDQLTWTFSNGVLTIGGTGAMETYYMKIPAPWDELNNSISSVVIQEGVTSIGDFAFASYTTREDYTNLTSVTIPLSVTKIGFAAFAGCDNLNVTYYAGNQSQWNNIDFQEYNNPLTASTIHFSGETHTPTPLDIALQGASVDYNNNLALIAADLSLATYSGNGDSAVRDYLYDLDFEEGNIYSNNYGGSLAFTVATRPYYGKDASGCTDILVIIAQGTTNPYELYNDAFSIYTKINGYTSYVIVRDFYNAIREGIEHMTQEHILSDEKNYKVFLTGHSLGGAAADLTASVYTNQGGSDDVYCYTFGAINSIVSDSPRGYRNIHNIYNDLDTFSPAQYGWMLPNKSGMKYGKLGHLDTFEYDYRDPEFASWWGAVLQISYHINHEMHNYREAVLNGRVVAHSQLNSARSYAIFACPVDIDILCENELVGRIQNNVVDESVTSIDTIIDGDIKFVLFPDNRQYEIKITATGNGIMSYCIHDKSETDVVKLIHDVALTPGKEMYSQYGGVIKANDVKLYVINDGLPIREVHEDGTETDIAHTHVWNDGTVTTSASCTATGVRTYICEVCGESKNDTIAAVGHSYEGGICKTCGEKQPGFTPRLIEGNNGVALYDTNYTIKSNCSYSTFLAVYVDDIMLSPANYDAYEGSIAVVLKASYINSLARGIHSIRIASTLGNADGIFTVAQGQQTSNSTYIFNIDPSNQTNYARQNPPTGDSNDVNKWLLLTVTSLFCLTCLITYIRWYQKKH